MAVDHIKDKYLGSPEWLDSYARTLSNSLDRVLRIDQKDYEYFKPQLDYLDELLYVRYRLNKDDIERMDQDEISGIILSKDAKLEDSSGEIYKDSKQENAIVKQKDDLLDRLFGSVKASKDNKNVERQR